ncbi:MAG: threonine--tRNA ligase, partial [Clostridia bacterium]
MMKIILKNGENMEIGSGMSALDVAKQISEGLARNAVCAKINDVIMDISTIVPENATFEILTIKDEEGMKVVRHTMAHILAQAVKEIYPTATLAIGPATSEGFFYDFDFKEQVTNDDLEKIEAEMKKIIKADFPITRREATKAQAIKLMKSEEERYKLEIIAGIPDSEKLTIYKQGNFEDICRGPHLPRTGMIKAFKLTKVAGAYWKGDSKNKMLTRIYGVVFEKKSEMDEYFVKLEEAMKRDHNKIGRDLELFTTNPLIGQGLPILLPKGAKVIQLLERFVEDEEEKRGYLLTKTPYFAKSDFYKLSGHWDHYKDGMFVMGDEEKDEEVYALRPMTCPFQFQAYLNRPRSYKDLPLRYNETSTLFRNESSGEMHGLIRVRQFTISEGHLAC